MIAILKLCKSDSSFTRINDIAGQHLRHNYCGSTVTKEVKIEGYLIYGRASNSRAQEINQKK